MEDMLSARTVLLVGLAIPVTLMAAENLTPQLAAAFEKKIVAVQANARHRGQGAAVHAVQ